MNRQMKTIYCLLALLCLALTPLQAQEEAAPETEPEGWTTGGGIGLDLSQLLQINPKQGAGQNRLGFGSAINLFGNYREDRRQWDNQASWQFGMQKLGSGVVPFNGQEFDIPFQKSLDELRLGSKYGYQTSETSKWFYAANATFVSQVTPTYAGPAAYPGNFVSDVFNSGRAPRSRFLAPATATLSVGIDYAPNDNLSLYYSPVGAKFIIVADDSIAVRGVHGNPVTRNEDGRVTDFQNVDAQFGSLLRADYNQSGLDDRLVFTSTLTLYSNYLDNPQNIDVDWVNQVAFELFENLQLTLLANIFYDDDVNVQITDYDFPNGIRVGADGEPLLGKRVNITQQFLITYSRVF